MDVFGRGVRVDHGVGTRTRARDVDVIVARIPTARRHVDPAFQLDEDVTGAVRLDDDFAALDAVLRSFHHIQLVAAGRQPGVVAPVDEEHVRPSADHRAGGNSSGSSLMLSP